MWSFLASFKFLFSFFRSFLIFFLTVVKFLIKQLFYSGLLDIACYAPRWLSIIRYPARPRRIIVKCNLCDAGYIGYTRGHNAWSRDGHKQKSSSIYKHYKSEHNAKMPERFLEQFYVLAKCNNKFDCLIKEMLFIRKLQPNLNVQTDYVRAKVFV